MNEVKERYVRTLVYDAIAQLLPTLGRDFTVKLIFVDDNHLNVEVEAHTPIGMLVRQELLKNLYPKITELMSEINKKEGNND